MWWSRRKGEDAIDQSGQVMLTHETTGPQILGIRFFNGTGTEVARRGLGGGLVVVPLAPVLVALESNQALREALVDADLAIADSGFMVLLWRASTRRVTKPI